MSDQTHLDWEMCTVATTVYANGFIGVQPVPLGDGGSMQPIEAHSLPGFISRPRDPDAVNGVPTSAANVLVGWEGSRGHAIMLGDPRVMPKLPQVKKGGSIQYAERDDGKVVFFALDGGDGGNGVTLYVPCASKAISLSINVENAGAESFQIVHAAGMGFSMVAGGNNAVTLNNKAGDAYMQIGDDGVTIGGNLNHVGSFNVGIPSLLELATNPIAPSPDGLVMGSAFQTWLALLTTACAAATPPITVPPFPPTGITAKLKGA